MTELNQKLTGKLTLNRDKSESTKLKTGYIKVRGKHVYTPIRSTKAQEQPRKQLSRSEKIEREELKLRNKNIMDATKWLMSNYPKIFNQHRLVPLSVGIHRSLLEAHKKQGGAEKLGFGWNPLKRALRKWTHSTAYIKQLTDTDMLRRGLAGCIAGEVTTQDATAAKKTLARINSNLRKKRNK